MALIISNNFVQSGSITLKESMSKFEIYAIGLAILSIGVLLFLYVHH